MSYTLSESLTHTAGVSVPTDGDDLDGASVEVAFQALTNRTALAHAQLTGAMPCTGGALLCNAGIVADGPISAHQPVYCDSGLYSNGGFTCNGSAEFNSVVNFNWNTNLGTGLVTSSGTIAAHNIQADAVSATDITASNQFVGKMRRQLRYLRVASDANQSLTVASLDHVSCGNVLTAQRTWDLVTTGLVAGDSCEFVNRSNQNVLLKVGGSTVFTLVAATFDYRITLIWNGSAFEIG